MLYRAEAVVLKGKEFGEKDRIVTLYSRQHGKIRAIAKGVKKPQSSLGPATEPFSYGTFLLATGKNLDVVTQARIKEPFPPLREDMERMAYASLLVELVDLASPEGEPNPELFDLLVGSLFRMKRLKPRIVALEFLAKFLDLLGWGPSLERCTKCEAEVSAEGLKFSPGTGGVLCATCKAEDAFPLSGEAWAIMKTLRRADPSLLPRLRITRAGLEGAERAYFSLLARHAEIVPKSLEVIRRLREEVRRG